MRSAIPTASALDRLLHDRNDIVERLRAVRGHIDGRIVFTSSIGIEDQAILHAITAADVAIDVVTFDTGRLFPETLATIDASSRRYGRPIAVAVPDAVETSALVARDGILGFRSSVDARKACCHVRKVRPLEAALKGAAAWVVGLRRGQSADRAATPFAAYDPAFDVLKVSPIADWSDERLADFVGINDIPLNPLHAEGYPSIGCAPCTRPVAPGEDPRSGRWWWELLDGKECGLHTRRRTEGGA